MMEWFHRSMNHERKSSTVTGQERKKHGPERDRDNDSTRVRESQRQRQRARARDRERERERKTEANRERINNEVRNL